MGFVFAILAAALFGSVSTLAKPVVSSVHPILVSSFVYLAASATLTPFAVGKKQRRGTKRDYFVLGAIAASGAIIAPILYFFGLQESTAANTGLLTNAEVMFTVLLALLFFKEKLKARSYFAIALVVAGLLVITTNLSFSQSLFTLTYGNMMIIIATLFWAIDNNLSRILARRWDVAKVAQLKSLIGGSALLVIALAFNLPLDKISTDQIAVIIFLGAAGFGASLYFLLYALKLIGTIRAIVIFSFSSVFSLAFASLFLLESVSIYQVAAAGVMIIGVYLASKEGHPEPSPN